MVINRKGEIVVVIVMRAPKHARVAFVFETLRGHVYFRKSYRDVRAHSQRGRKIRGTSLRLTKLHGRRDGHAPLGGRESLHANSRILNRNVVDYRRNILRLIRQTHPRNVRLCPTIRIDEDGFPLYKSGRRAFHDISPGIFIGSDPSAPILLWARCISGADVKRDLALRRTVAPLGSYPGPSVKIFPGFAVAIYISPLGPAMMLVTCADAVFAMLEYTSLPSSERDRKST